METEDCALLMGDIVASSNWSTAKWWTEYVLTATVVAGAQEPTAIVHGKWF